MRLAISAFVRAPNKVITPARIHTNKSSSGEPSCAAMTPGLRKMPEPITPPTTSITVENNPSVGNNPARDCGWSGLLMARECGKKSSAWIVPNTVCAWKSGCRRRICPECFEVRMNLRLYDAHNHLQDERFGGRQTELLSVAAREGVTCVVVNGSCEEDWPQVLELA